MQDPLDDDDDSGSDDSDCDERISRRGALAGMAAGIALFGGDFIAGLKGDEFRGDAIEARAKAIAEDLQDQRAFVGIEPTFIITLLTTLLPMLLKCFMPQTEEPSPAQLKAAVGKHWNKRRGEYDKGIVRRAKFQAKKQSKAAGKLLTDQQAELMAIETLDHARLGEDDDIRSFSAAAWASPLKAAVED